MSSGRMGKEDERECGNMSVVVKVSYALRQFKVPMTPENQRITALAPAWLSARQRKTVALPEQNYLLLNFLQLSDVETFIPADVNEYFDTPIKLE